MINMIKNNLKKIEDIKEKRVIVSTTLTTTEVSQLEAIAKLDDRNLAFVLRKAARNFIKNNK